MEVRMTRAPGRPVFFATDPAGEKTLLQAGRLEIPRKLFAYESDCEGRSDDLWRGCNHCGSYVSDDCQRVEWRSGPEQTPLFMHEYCFLKTHTRDYAIRVFGFSRNRSVC